MCLDKSRIWIQPVAKIRQRKSEDNEIPVDNSCAVIWHLSSIKAIKVPFALFLRLLNGGKKDRGVRMVVIFIHILASEKGEIT